MYTTDGKNTSIAVFTKKLIMIGSLKKIISESGIMKYRTVMGLILLSAWDCCGSTHDQPTVNM